MYQGEPSQKSRRLSADAINEDLFNLELDKSNISSIINNLEELKKYIIEPLTKSVNIVMSSGPLNLTPNFETALKQFVKMLPREPIPNEIITALEITRTNKESIDLAKNISNHKYIETVAKDPKNLLAVTMGLIIAFKNIELKLTL